MNKTAVSQITVSIIGLGYVGFPLACVCAEKQFNVHGIDVDLNKIGMINEGVCPLHDPVLQEAFGNTRFPATTDCEVIRDSNIVVVCVPTPVDVNHNPDFTPLENSCEMIMPYLRKDHLIVIESTVNPGACEKVVQPILEKSGLKAGKDFDIAHCPERINPGSEEWTVRKIPRVVGATTPAGLQKALDFYRSFVDADIIPMNTIKEAEATKIMENAFRDINIAFVNELAVSFDKMGIDIVRVIKAASSKPFSFLAHYPGCGVGGHCIPVDPYYLIREAKNNGFNHKLLLLAREINESMPAYTVGLLAEELGKIHKTVRKTNIGILGLAFKPDVADTRESPAFTIIKLLKEKGANPDIFDPLIIEKSTVPSLEALIEKSEALILVTSHRQFLNMRLEKLKDSPVKILIDGRNCLDKEKIQQLGIAYRGIGR
jgi:nucleotide sugar dehydrogenase